MSNKLFAILQAIKGVAAQRTTGEGGERSEPTGYLAGWDDGQKDGRILFAREVLEGLKELGEYQSGDVDTFYDEKLIEGR